MILPDSFWTSLPATLASLAALIGILLNRTKVGQMSGKLDDVHKQTNGRVDQLLDEARKNSYRQGVDDGVAQEQKAQEPAPDAAKVISKKKKLPPEPMS